MTIIDLSTQGGREGAAYASILSDMCREFGVDHLACGMEVEGHAGVYAYSTYPAAWTEHYAKNKLWLLDPVILTARAVATPFDWSRLRSHENYAAVQAAAKVFGVPKNGMSFPVRGPRGTFSILSISKQCTDSEWHRHISSRIATLTLLSLHLHESLVRVVLGPSEASPYLPLLKLDRREREVLEALAAEPNADSAMQCLGMNRRTFRTCVKAAKMKLNALSNEHAVARATTLGLIKGA